MDILEAIAELKRDVAAIRKTAELEAEKMKVVAEGIKGLQDDVRYLKKDVRDSDARHARILARIAESEGR